MLYGREVWTLSDSSSDCISVAWNNCFRRIFGCCWTERKGKEEYLYSAFYILCISQSAKAWITQFYLQIHHACLSESVRPLQDICNILPVSYITDLMKLVFWRSLRRSENPALRTLAYLNHSNFIATACKYGSDN